MKYLLYMILLSLANNIFSHTKENENEIENEDYHTLLLSPYDLGIESEDFEMVDDGTGGFSAIKFHKETPVTVPLEKVAVTHLSSPYIIYSVFKLDDPMDSCLFSIKDVDKDSHLSLCISLASATTTKIVLEGGGLPIGSVAEFTYAENFADWTKMLLHIGDKSVTLYVNCTRIDSLQFENSVEEIYFSDKANLSLGHDGTGYGYFKGAIEQIKIITNADDNILSLENDCSGELKLPSTFTDVDFSNSNYGRKDENTCSCSESVVLSLLRNMSELRGPPGEQGPRGDIGDTGPRGLTGLPGLQGNRGPEGLRGEAGERGDIGPPGRDGKDGSPGTPGDKGDHGHPGLPGTPASIRSLLDPTMDPVEKAEIVEKLKGHKGDVGAPGTQGIKGDRGSTGPIGPPGRNGKDGRHGSPGKRGSQGSQGKAGPAGPRGPKGETGAPGPPGNVTTSNGSVVKGPPGPPGEKGPPGPKGERGESALSLIDMNKLKGEKGDRGSDGTPGDPGKQGPPGQCPQSCQAQTAGASGPPGPPGRPGVSITGPKGEPGHLLTHETFYSFTDNGNNLDGDEDDDVHTAMTLIYRTITALIKHTVSTPVGTLAYVLREKTLLLRVENGWQYVTMGSIMKVEDHQTTTSLRPAPSHYESSTPPVPNYKRSPDDKVIRLAALNEPYAGNMLSVNNKTGISSANLECYQQARKYGYQGTFVPYLAHSVQDLVYAVQSNKDVPVVNIYGQSLFHSWPEMFNGSGARFTQLSNIYSFNGKNIYIDSAWPTKAVWHGATKYGIHEKKAFCEDWESSSTKLHGYGSLLSSNKLLDQTKFPCDNKLIVLCVDNAPTKITKNKDSPVRRRQRHSPSRRRSQQKRNPTSRL